jgi:hypothetical protein
VPFFDKHEIHGMEDWRQRFLQGLRESRLLLACLSPTYLTSEYCEWEMVEYLKYEIGHLHGFNGVAPIYFVQVPGWEDRDFDKKLRGVGGGAAAAAELRLEAVARAGRGGAARGGGQRADDGAQSADRRNDSPGRAGRSKSLGNVDAHNPHFIGRGANLRMMRENFVKPGQIGVVTAVNGIGGLGKTALAVEYAHAFADEYGGGRWQVRCAGKDDLRLALSELATPMGFEFSDDEKKNPTLRWSGRGWS